MRCGKRPSKRPGETPDCDLTEARQFNLMFRTRVGAVEETGTDVYLRPETAQGIFINFKNVAQLARRKPPFGIAQVGKSFRNEITPGNFIFRTLEFEQMEMEYFVPPDDAEEWYRYWVDERLAWHAGTASARATCASASTTPTSSRTTRAPRATSSTCSRWAGRSSRASRTAATTTSRRHAEASGAKLEWVDPGSGERYVPHVIEPALGVNRSMLVFMIDAYDEEVVRRPRAHGAAAPSCARACEGGRAAADRQGRGMVGEGALALRGAAPARSRSSTTRAARSAAATGGRTRSARPGA